MYKGTTPTIRINITSDLELSTLTEVWITIKSWETKITQKFSKDEVNVNVEDKYISTFLSQEMTLSFEDDDEVEIQARLLDENNLAYVTEITQDVMHRVLEDGVISVGD